VEKPIRQDLNTDVSETFTVYQAQQVVPLQHLVQQDAVYEPAQSEAQDSGGNVWIALSSGGTNLGH
jgi:hypothetical protein